MKLLLKEYLKKSNILDKKVNKLFPDKNILYPSEFSFNPPCISLFLNGKNINIKL